MNNFTVIDKSKVIADHLGYGSTVNCGYEALENTTTDEYAAAQVESNAAKTIE